MNDSDFGDADRQHANKRPHSKSDLQAMLEETRRVQRSLLNTSKHIKKSSSNLKVPVEEFNPPISDYEGVELEELDPDKDEDSLEILIEDDPLDNEVEEIAPQDDKTPPPQENSAPKSKTIPPTKAIKQTTKIAPPPITRRKKKSIIANKFEVKKLLGKGGMGEVYLVQDLLMKRQVALKGITPQKEIEKQRFFQEIRTCAALKHKNIITIHELGEDGRLIFYIMEYIEGLTILQHMRREKKMPLEWWLNIMLQIVEAIAYAHNTDTIHRDIKPENIMITKDQSPIIMDFGLGKRLSEAQSANLTQANAMMGTPVYMAPETIDRKGADKLSDIYSLGMVLYFILNDGKTAFVLEKPGKMPQINELFNKIRQQPPPRISEIDDELWAICKKALEKERTKRYQTADDFVFALKKYLAGEPLPPDVFKGGIWYRCKKRFAQKRKSLR